MRAAARRGRPLALQVGRLFVINLLILLNRCWQLRLCLLAGDYLVLQTLRLPCELAQRITRRLVAEAPGVVKLLIDFILLNQDRTFGLHQVFIT